MAQYKLNIGDKEFKTKKEALEHYKSILNSYKPTDELNHNDFKQIKELYQYHKNSNNIEIKKIIIDEHAKYKSTKCFFIIFPDNKKEVFSYTIAVNGALSKEKLFTNACREAISVRLRKFKKSVFKQRPVTCALTNETVEWDECHIDHKNPLTFSVIVKAFITAKDIDIHKIQYSNKDGLILFHDESLTQSFDEFHKKMAVLRIVAKHENLKRSGTSRVKPTAKDFLL